MTRVTWKAIAAGEVGRQHAADGHPCEDAWLVRRRAASPAQPGRVAVCLSDGAGSAAHAAAGARCAAAAAAYWLTERFNPESPLPAGEVARQLVSWLQRRLRRAAKNLGAKLSDLAATLVAAVVCEDGQWIVIHIGDGGVVGLVGSELRLLSAPAKGEWINTTNFVTQPQAWKNAQVVDARGASASFPPGEATLDGLALFTDGLEHLFVDRKSGRCAPALAHFLNWFTLHSAAETASALQENLTQVLRPQTVDDLSLGLIVRERLADELPPATPRAASAETPHVEVRPTEVPAQHLAVDEVFAQWSGGGGPGPPGRLLPSIVGLARACAPREASSPLRK